MFFGYIVNEDFDGGCLLFILFIEFCLFYLILFLKLLLVKMELCEVLSGELVVCVVFVFCIVYSIVVGFIRFIRYVFISLVRFNYI